MSWQHLLERHLQPSCERRTDEGQEPMLTQGIEQQPKSLIQEGCCEPTCSQRGQGAVLHIRAVLSSPCYES